MYLIGKSSSRPNIKRKYQYHKTDPSTVPSEKKDRPSDGMKQMLLKPLEPKPTNLEMVKKAGELIQVSDIRIHDIYQLLRIWISQLVENSVERNAKKIEVRLYDQGKLGFDIIDDGEGIEEQEFDNDYVKCMPMRARNEIYKT
eukprot:403360311